MWTVEGGKNKSKMLIEIEASGFCVSSQAQKPLASISINIFDPVKAWTAPMPNAIALPNVGQNVVEIKYGKPQNYGDATLRLGMRSSWGLPSIWLIFFSVEKGPQVDVKTLWGRTEYFSAANKFLMTAT